MIDEDAFLIKRNVFGRTRIGCEHALLKTHQILDTGQLKIESRLLDDTFGIAKLDNHALLPLANGEDGLRSNNDKD